MAKRTAKGTALQYEDPNTPGTYITVAQCKDFDGPEDTTDEIDVTTHDSADDYKEFLPGLQDGGTVSFDIELDPEDTASQAQLRTFKQSREVVNWRLVFPTTNLSRLEFIGFVNSFSLGAPVEGSITGSCGIRVSGKPTLVASPA